MSKTVPFQTIQISISTQFKSKYSLIVKKTFLFQATQFIINMQLYLTNRLDPIRFYHSGPEWTWEQWQWWGALHSPKLQHHWNLTIRLFRVIYRTLIGGSYPSAKVQLVYSTDPLLGKEKLKEIVALYIYIYIYIIWFLNFKTLIECLKEIEVYITICSIE